MLHTHCNPMIGERGSDLKKKNKPVAIDQTLFDLTEKLLEYCRNDDPNQPFMAVVKGEVGSGKTLFALSLLDELNNSSDFRMLGERQGKAPLFTSSLNAETELQFLNIWRPVLQMMLLHICKRDNIRKDKVLKILLNEGGDDARNENKLELLCDILAIDMDLVRAKFPKKVVEAPQIEPKKVPFPFVSRPDYEERNDIIELLLVFFKLGIGETDDLSVLHQSKFKNSRTRDDNSDTQSQADSDRPTTIIILDDAHLMDQASW